MHRANFANNSAHSSMMGVITKGGFCDHSSISDITLWRVRDVGIWGFTLDGGMSNPVISDVTIADTRLGFFWAAVGADPTEHALVEQTITVRDSVFVGRSASNPTCWEDCMWTPGSCGRQIGISIPIFSSAGSISPEQCGPIGGGFLGGIYGSNHPVGSHPPILGDIRVTRVGFYGYDGACDGATVLQTHRDGQGMNVSDVVHPIFLSQISIDDASSANLADIMRPQRNWIVPTKCGVMDCDGLKHAIIHDVDGTLTGQGARSSVLARAEFMHHHRNDPTKFTWYNIPNKMLYDPAPLNNLDDPGMGHVGLRRCARRWHLRAWHAPAARMESGCRRSSTRRYR